MARAKILTSRRKLWVRILRRHTRDIRFILNLIKLRLRLWVTPIWPVSLAVIDDDLPESPWKGSVDNARALISGEFCENMGGEEPYDDFWMCIQRLSPNVQRRMHEFQWLRDLANYDEQDEAAEFARKLMDEWWHYEFDHPEFVNTVTIRAERLVYCLNFYDLIFHNAPKRWKRKQQNHYFSELLLLGDILRRKEHYAGFSTMKALLFSSFMFPAMRFYKRPVYRILDKALAVRFYADGGHRTRSPEFHRWDIATLIELRSVLKQKQIPIKPDFDLAMQRGLDALATMTHGDGRLACFHDSIEQPVDKFINLWLSWRKPKPLPQQTLPKTGFVHLKRSESTIIFDVGYKPVSRLHHHSSPLSFEFSRHGARVIANCGAYRGEEEAWKEASYSTAAHSTLSIDAYDAWTGQEESTVASFKAGFCSVEEQNENVTLVADHYGYADYFGIVHEREITLSQDGAVVQGIDRIREVPQKLIQPEFAAESIFIRFHLHPTVSIEKIVPEAVVLRLKNDELWHFSLEGEVKVPQVEESIYLGEDGLPKPTLQLVVEVPFAESSAETERAYGWKLAFQRA